MSGGDLGVSEFPEGASTFIWMAQWKVEKELCTRVYHTNFHCNSHWTTLSSQLKSGLKPCASIPNADQFGNIWLDILQDEWSFTMIAELFYCPFRVYIRRSGFSSFHI
ncbi:hypothetical protein SLA2020_065810 [Shorea laevis]